VAVNARRWEKVAHWRKLMLGEEAVTAPEKDDKKAALLARA
jgi:hypothetical protein